MATQNVKLKSNCKDITAWRFLILDFVGVLFIIETVFHLNVMMMHFDEKQRYHKTIPMNSSGASIRS